LAISARVIIAQQLATFCPAIRAGKINPVKSCKSCLRFLKPKILLTGFTGLRAGLREDYFCFGRTPKQKVLIRCRGIRLGFTAK
jgi:hypothetical protein